MKSIPERIDLAPGKWVWWPSQRTLANTVVLFRRDVKISGRVKSARGWIVADSRYRLSVNGKRVQWGPAPCDPRWMEADPVDITGELREGENVIGVQVLFYGHGEGTWAMGKPGMLFRLEIEYEGGRVERVVSDGSWQCCVDRAYRPGQYKRWFLRAFQEEFDARRHPWGWDEAGYVVDERWAAAMVVGEDASRPTLCVNYSEYSSDAGASDMGAMGLYKRTIPHLLEKLVAAKRLRYSARVKWNRDPADWFEFRTPGSFAIQREELARPRDASHWEVPAAGDAEGHALTFEFSEQIVGWPYFTIDAPAGTVVELMVQESHDPEKTSWLDTHHYCWARFICREGVNRFECFDFESLRWMQLHIRGHNRPVTVGDVGVRRRVFDWPNEAKIRIAEPALQRLMDASVNTLHNSAQETCVDGMGRERQQYSGDGGHQLHAIRYAFGETRLPARFLRTFSQGLTLDGFFLDCWPAYDRLARLQQRQVGATGWGPLLDHGVGFNFDGWNHYWETGDLDALREPYPRLLTFAEYLQGLRGADGLLPVENIGVPSVWMDHWAYQQQKHKQCAFNLYAAAMFEHAIAKICRAFGHEDAAAKWGEVGRQVLAAAVHAFWDEGRGVFVVNRPWLAGETGVRMCDRSLATSILFDQCPRGKTEASAKALAECPQEMGLSYPCNAGWRMWALAKAGRIDVVLSDLRKRWATMRSVVENNTLAEIWDARPDSGDQFSHCAVVPLYVLFMDIAGIRPAAPGFAKVVVRPQLGDLKELELTARTVKGNIEFAAKAEGTGHRVRLKLPAGCEGEVQLARERLALRTGAVNEFLAAGGK